MSYKFDSSPIDKIFNIVALIFVLSIIIFGSLINNSFRTQKNTFLNLNTNIQAMQTKCPELISNDPKMLGSLTRQYRSFNTEFAKFNQKMTKVDLNHQQIAIGKKMVSAASRFQNIFAKHPDFAQAKKNDKDFAYKFEALCQSIVEANQTINDWKIYLENQKNPPPHTHVF